MIINQLEFTQRVHIDQTTLDVWLGEQWLLPNRSMTDMEFTDIDLARAALILDLQRELGVNAEGIGIIFLTLWIRCMDCAVFWAHFCPPTATAFSIRSNRHSDA